MRPSLANTRPGLPGALPPGAGGSRRSTSRVRLLVDVVLMDNAMTAVINLNAPAKNQPWPTIDEVRAVLHEHGVVQGIDDDGIQIALAGAQETGEPLVGLIAARGSRGELGRDGSVDLDVSLPRVLTKGTAVARMTDATGGVDGWTVTGRTLPQPHGKEPRIQVGDGLQRAGQILRAARDGILVLQDEVLAVRVPVTFREDKLAACLWLPPEWSHGVAGAMQLLKACGVVYGVDEHAVGRAVGLAVTGAMPVDGVEVARGVSAVPGEDGRVELFVETGPSVGRLMADDRIDYRDRNAARLVLDNQCLARVLPPTPGTPGRCVTGEEVLPRTGVRVALEAGTGVVRHGDALHAVREGMVSLRGKFLSVEQCWHIEGDVGPDTGHVRMPLGGVLVDGSIKSTFGVKAGADVKVGGSCEAAWVEAGGDLTVERGVSLHGKGTVQVGGSLSALFVQDADMTVGGDVDLKRYISNSRLCCGGRITVHSARGRIMGGEVLAAEGIEVAFVGTEMGTGTVVGVDHARGRLAAVRARVRELEGRLLGGAARYGWKGAVTGGAGNTGDGGDGTGVKTRGQMEELLALREEERVLAADSQYQAESVAGVIVRDTIFPGSRVTIEGRTFSVDVRLKRVRFWLDAKSGQVVWESLASSGRNAGQVL